MSVNTTTTSQPSATTAGATLARTTDQARVAWATAPRDTELDRWQELYALAVPGGDRAPEAGQ
jgi:hypothetical protein